MPSPAEVTAEHYRAQQRQERAAVLLARRQWRRMSLAGDLDAEWAKIIARLLLIVSSAQLGAATAGAAYVAQAVAVRPDAQVEPNAWSGVASDGRPLDSLLYSAVVQARTLMGSGTPLPQAMAAGGDWLDTLVQTQVSDAARGAAGVAIAARPRVGWVRLVDPPCCQRCAVLSGKHFKWNQGFQRHPKCDCRHVPDQDSEPSGYTAAIQPDQIKDLTIAQRQAVADGADLNQVINAHRAGARSADGMTTSEGTTRRGYASYVRREFDRQRSQQTAETVARARGGRRNVTRTRPRLTPEAIYRLSATREEALRLLRLNGYIVGDIRQLARELTS